MLLSFGEGTFKVERFLLVTSFPKVLGKYFLAKFKYDIP